MGARRYFGTDGIRGRFGSATMNPGFARAVGAALGLWLKQGGDEPGSDGLHRVLIGRDTRASGKALATALAEGLASQGVATLDAGIVPTPAIALAIPIVGASMGMVVTASHNPAEDNGVKLFSSQALKLDDATELAIEALIDAVEEAPPDFPDVDPEPYDALELYCERLRGLLVPGSLQGWTIACDTAHGATVQSTPAVLRSLGATVHTIGDAPDGQNINVGLGSEHPGRLTECVRSTGARIGIAHDGDGDRVLLCDETGAVVDGDEVLAMVGLHMLHQGELARSTVVAIMSNLGLDAAIQEDGGHVVRVSVGDRHVLEAMEAHGYNFGGEASGHFIFRDYSTTGDGLLAALQVIRLMRDSGQPLSALRQVLRLYPQLRRNLKVREKRPLESIPGFEERVAQIERRMGRGRVLLRYSGTEAKIRLLAEAGSEAAAQSALAALEALVRQHLEVL